MREKRCPILDPTRFPTCECLKTSCTWWIPEKGGNCAVLGIYYELQKESASEE